MCHGARLKPEALAVTIAEKNINDVTTMSVEVAEEFFRTLGSTDRERQIAQQIFKEIRARLGFLTNVGLGYLNLSRSATTLSGGESQRIRLATQIGSSLVGVLYILDEPSIGLHQRDNDRLLATLQNAPRSSVIRSSSSSTTKIRCAKRTSSSTSVRARARRAAAS